MDCHPRLRVFGSALRTIDSDLACLTYDREVIKVPAAKLAELHQRLGAEIKR